MKLLRFLSAVLVGLWLAACTHTAATGGPKPQKQETRKNTETRRTTSSETVGSKAQEAGEKSKTGPAASPETTAVRKKETAEEPRTGQTASTDAPAHTLEKTGEKTDTGEPASAQTAESKLDTARENLRISKATEQRIASKLEQLKKSGNASPEMVKEHEIYLQRVREMVAENQNLLDRMEATYADHSTRPVPSGSAAADGSREMLNPEIPEEQEADGLAALDRKLNESLAEFDERLLKELDTIQAKSSERMRDLAEEAAEAARRLREKAGELDREASESSADREDDAMDREQKAPAGDEASAREGSRAGGEGPTREQHRRYDDEDDDIVARQLREAAENETDPELKEKLWREYEEYKKNRI